MNDQPQPPVPSESDYGARPTALPDLTPEDWDIYDGEVREPVTTTMPNGPKRRFELVRFDQIKLPTDPAYLVKGLTPREGLCVVWGPPKCGKSF